MTLAPAHPDTERTPAVRLPAGASGPAEPPRLADGVELLGEYQDSGYRQPPSLVRRPDGQVIQMSPLLYQVTCSPAWSPSCAASCPRGPGTRA
jgi:hypothetical protein